MVERLGLASVGAPERRHGRYRVLDVDHARYAEAAVGDDAVGRYDVVEAVTFLCGTYVACVEVAPAVEAVTVDVDRGVVEAQVDTLLYYQRAARTYLCDELREGFVYRLQRAVYVEVVGIGCRHYGSPERASVSDERVRS